MKAGKELKRDMEYALVRNQASSAGGAGTARTSAGIESWIVNRVLATGSTAGSTPGFSSGTVAAPTDGTSVTFVEADLKSALQLAWVDGGEPTLVLMSATNKARFSAFSGITTKFNNVRDSSQATITGAADMYTSDFGNHTVKLDRFMRDAAVLAVDPNYVSVATLRPMAKEELAKVGDSQNWLLTTEYALVVNNPDAHAKVQNAGA
jgi:hypothetical protein